MSHYATLVLAEKPLEAHQQYKRRRSSVAAGQLPPDIELGAQVCSTPCLGSGVLPDPLPSKVPDVTQHRTLRKRGRRKCLMNLSCRLC